MRSLAALALLLLSTPPEPSAIRIEVGGEGFDGRSVRLVATPLSTDGAPAIERSVAVPGGVDLPLTAGAAYRVHAELSGAWAAPAIVDARREARSTVRFDLVPAGELSGRVAARDVPMLRSLDLRIGRGAGRERGLAVADRCPIDRGRFRCAVPAGRLDLRLRLGSSIPIYVWDRAVDAGRASDLGLLAFAAGSSVVGRVESAAGSVPPAGARVRLGAAAPLSVAGSAAGERLAGLALEARPDARGFFQFRGVPPGRYSLRVDSAGFAPTELAPIIVEAGLETELPRPVVLHPLASLAVALDPPLDPLDRPWRLRLEREAQFGGGSFAGAADEAGLWQQRGLGPGRWHLRVLGDEGSFWADEVVDLEGADRTIAVEIEAIQIEGRATIGDEPFSGTLWFGGVRGPRRVRFDPDGQGEFTGLLPGEGRWEVHAEDAAAGVDGIALDPVEVRRRPGRTTARVEIAVPDTHVEGRVVGESGRGVAGTIEFFHGRGTAQARTGADGRYRLRGLQPGRQFVQAEAGERTSEPREVAIEEGRPTTGLEVMVRDRLRVRGVVRSATGPVAGAEVMLWPALDGSGMSALVQAVSGPDGSFDIALARGGPAIDAVVRAPGYALAVGRYPLPGDGGPLTLALDVAAGELALDLLPGAAGGPPRAGLLSHRGASVPALLLARWGRLDESRLSIPAVEAGAWSLCLPAPERGGAPGRCVDGWLSPGGRLSLR